jgi:hypothetical protein
MNLHQECQSLFTQYPLAADPFDDGAEMVFAVLGPGAPEFFVLISYDDGEIALRRWNSMTRLGINPDGTLEERDGLTPAQAEQAVKAALPSPHDGSMLAWAPSGTATALVTFYGRGWEDAAPVFSPMPRAGLPERDWPPFIGEPILGPWVWDHIRAGRLADAGSSLAGTHGAAYWVSAGQNDRGGAAGHVAVARDVRLSQGIILPRGLYAYWKSLRLGGVPTLEDALADRGKTDLGPRFRETAQVAP